MKGNNSDLLKQSLIKVFIQIDACAILLRLQSGSPSTVQAPGFRNLKIVRLTDQGERFHN